jgi:hypothetical protein
LSILLIFAVVPRITFVTRAAAIVKGPTLVFFKYLSYPKIIANKSTDIPNVVTLIRSDKISAMAVNMITRTIATFLDILPEAMGLFGLSFLSIS